LDRHHRSIFKRNFWFFGIPIGYEQRRQTCGQELPEANRILDLQLAAEHLKTL
jgi:hypothetical protein